MRKRFRKYSIGLIIIFLLTPMLKPPLPVQAANDPSLNFSVIPSSSELTLNADSLAEGSLNINVTPEGTVGQKQREPIDLAFVYDTSGSMDDFFGGKKKSKSAKEALESALNYFGQSDNQVSGDNFYFIPFNDDVRTSGQVKVVDGINNIRNQLNQLERNSIGGTNYTQTLEYTQNKLNQSNNKNKYIIFLTDGEPTVLNYRNNKYILYTNGTALYNGWTSKSNYGKTRDLIHRVAEETSRELAASNMTMYSIGFAQEDEIDFQLLESMSAVTGGSAVRATTSNLTNIFQEISKKIDSYTISGEVTVDLQKFSGNVVVDPNTTAIVDENQVAHFPIKFTFPVGMAPDPSSIVVSLPLLFKKEGTYSFDNIKLNYDGLTTPKTHAPVTIKVNRDLNSVPGAVFEVKPSSEEFIKPPNDHAKGNIDITITSKGMAPRDERLPIDVVFVHDTSGSMADSFGGARRDTTAKNALQSAINYFEANSKEEDKFYFVPFDGEVSNKTQVTSCRLLIFCDTKKINIRPLEGLSTIKNAIGDLDLNGVSNGGTNYNAALNEATNKFVLGSNRNKYIIFLTDGEPTTLVYNNDKYEIFTNNTARKNGVNIPLADAKRIIREQALNISDSLGSKGITMYSIGFAQEGEVDFELLRNMSAKTGGYAVQGKTDNLTTIFDDMSKKVNATSISGNVSIDLKEFEGDVIVDPSSNFKANSQQVVQIPFNITFPAGEEPDPRIIQQTLPLQFKKAGTYDFIDNIVMSYTDHNGVQNTLKHDPFTVVVGEETAPYFLNEVDILGNQYYSPDSLVKLGSTDTERNEFFVEYKLWPETVFTEITNGNISNLKITQPLFDGISLANHDQITLYKNGERAEGITVKQINNGKDIEIELKNNEITYTSGNFSVDEYVIQLRLKADWALPYRLLPQANLHFYDSRFMDQNQSLNIDEQHISMRVHLKGMNYTYIGNHQGMIEKVHSQDGTVVAETQLSLEDDLIGKPVKEMRLINEGKAIEVTYFDQTKAVLHLKTDYKLKNLSLSEELQSGETTKGRVGFKITDLIAGENVLYEYQLKVNGSETDWQEFDPTATIELPKELEGKVEIRVRTKGGFSLNEEPIVKTLTIIKESISVEPNPIELNVGQSIPVEVKITPDDETERDFVISTWDPEIAEYEDGKVTGVQAGETVLQVTTTDIAGNEIIEEITIKVNPVLITSITVTPNPLSIGKLHEFKDFIIDIEPKNASNQELIWESLHPYVVGIVQPGRIYGKTTGTAEIEIKANDGSDVSVTIIVNVGSPLTGLEVDDTLVIEKGDTEKNMNDYFDYLPSDATNIKGDPSFTSKNEDILEVDLDGELIPKRLGETEVKISVQDEDDNTFTADLKVKVVEKGSTDSYDKDKY
ncbi:VWA domain-containing protein [Robertmurraya massiliosenegalensis]|uniref:VWA domain-containing protein n=1 Tax=Robertmurraya TaxID=2837507 RepID=UPI0039A5F39B